MGGRMLASCGPPPQWVMFVPFTPGAAVRSLRSFGFAASTCEGALPANVVNTKRYRWPLPVCAW